MAMIMISRFIAPIFLPPDLADAQEARAHLPTCFITLSRLSFAFWAVIDAAQAPRFSATYVVSVKF